MFLYLPHISEMYAHVCKFFVGFFSPPSLNGQKISCIQTNSTKFEVTGSKLIIKIFSAEIESRFARSHCILQPLLPCLLSSNSDYHVSTQVKTNRTRTTRRNRIADFIGEKKTWCFSSLSSLGRLSENTYKFLINYKIFP